MHLRLINIHVSKGHIVRLYYFIYFPILRGLKMVFFLQTRNKIIFFSKHCASAENNIVMFLCLFSGVELVVRDAQGGVSVYNVETNKHRVLLTSSSFVSANLLVSTEHTVFADWRQIRKAIRFFLYYFSHSELRFHVLAWIFFFKVENITNK